MPSTREFTLFLLTLVAVAGLVGFALLSFRAKAFWERVRQGFTILQDRERYIREVFLVQLGGWCFRFAAFGMLLEAFNVGGSVKNVLLVLGVNAVRPRPVHATGRRCRAGPAHQGLRRHRAGRDVASYSVGQQIAIGALTFGIGFAAIVFIFRYRSFKEVIARGQEERSTSRSPASLANENDGLREERLHCRSGAPGSAGRRCPGG